MAATTDTSQSGDGSKHDKLYLETPTVLSFPITKHCGFDVFLKLENLQPPGSFKIRGISNMIKKAMSNGGCNHVYCASGGNAGLAAAHASKQLGIPCTILLPVTTPEFVATKLRDIGAEVRVHGNVYDETKLLAEELGSQPGCVYVSAFDHPDIWEGHASMIHECAHQLPRQPDLVITSVGGGGLFNGVVQGMRAVGWQDTPVLAVETEGANCFKVAVDAGEVVTLKEIASAAKSLGSLVVSSQALKYQQEGSPRVINYLVTDKQAVEACVKFSDDHRCLVETACGASLATLYSDIIPKLQQDGQLGVVKTVLVIVCGGATVSTAVFEKWKQDFGLN